jgi:hypothetical protein
MSGDDNLERRLEAWLAETARPMPPELFEDVVTSASRAGRNGVRARFPSGGRWRLVTGALAVAILVVGIGAALRLPFEPSPGSTPAPPSSLGSDATPTAPGLGAWHRNNYNAGEEQLVCQEGEDIWTCDYTVPDGTGSFIGQVVTESWTCPNWFPRSICDNVTAVYRGYFAVDEPPEGQPAATPEIVRQEYVITTVGGQQVLQLYWVDRFVCPWYRTMEAALAADYNCVMAP